MKSKTVDLVCDIAELLSEAGRDDMRQNILQTVVTAVARHMQADVCSIYIYDEQSERLTLYATEGLCQSAVGKTTLQLGEGITGQALEKLQPICVGQVDQDTAYRFFPGIEEEHYKAFLAVPILRGKRRIGALVLQAKAANYFSANDIKSLRAIAAQLATMIENVRLLREIRKDPGSETQAISVGQRILRGRTASPGIARGKAISLASTQADACVLPDPNAPPYTLDDFQQAVELTAQQIEQLQRQTGEQLADVAILIFNAHLLILEDEQFTGRISNLIRSGTPAIKAISMVVNEFVEIFSNSKMPMIREKVLDVKDLGNRLLRNLLNQENTDTDYRGQIVIAHELLPSDILKLSAENVEGFIVSSGITSHNAIICRSLKLPMLALPRSEADSIPDEEPLLMDASQGILYIHPSQEVHEKYDHLQSTLKNLENAADQKEKTFTACGERVRILANINLLSDLAPAKKFKAEGVGLYRSEFPFIVRNDFPDEEEQFVIYKKLVEEMGDRPVTFRTLDIGGDKMLSYYSTIDEANPFLGMRAIRFSFQNKDIFVSQLRAFLRAGASGNTRIMFPFISSIDDFIAAREIVYECMDELEADGLPYCRKTPLGAMVELPAAVELIDELAQEADFLSIGSNDLVQYILAVDRTNEQVSNLYLAHHPAILRVLNRIVSAAKKHQKDVSLCGNLATIPELLPFLLGIGLRTFSIDILHAPALQKAIQATSITDAEADASTILSMRLIREIEDFLGTASDSKAKNC